MDLPSVYTIAATALVAIISLGLLRYLWSSPAKAPEVLSIPSSPVVIPEPEPYVEELAKALPGSVVLPRDVAGFGIAVKTWFSTQNRDLIPACIVQPRNVQELSTAMKHIRQEHAIRVADKSTVSEGLFAVRAGGANTATGISCAKNGVVIDLVHLKEVEPAKDGSYVTVGAGAYWRDVYKALEGTGLGVVGGRSSPVGVGGSTLQGGISFWSPQYGFMCSNVISYQVVLADGRIVTASADENADLWKALKGGGNNFGVVSQFKLRAFPAPDNIWSGTFVVMGFLGNAPIKAFHEHTRLAASGERFDEKAATPILSHSYLPDQGITAFFGHMAYTQPSENGNDWPEYWKKSPFRKLWRMKNTSANGTLRDAVVKLGVMSRTNERNVYGTTTVKNDLTTLLAIREIVNQGIPTIKHIKECMYIYIMQAILPQWMNEGTPNSLGLEDCKEPLVVISFAVNWKHEKDDAAARGTVRRMLELIEEYAEKNGTAHPYRFSNYSAEWQKPLHGNGEENMRSMRDVSRKYDPEGLFQTGCQGGFKLE